jgi:hypothetical protein
MSCVCSLLCSNCWANKLVVLKIGKCLMGEVSSFLILDGGGLGLGQGYGEPDKLCVKTYNASACCPIPSA